jgi:hypothetical protein
MDPHERTAQRRHGARARRLGNRYDELAAFLTGQLPSARLSEETSLDSKRAELRGRGESTRSSEASPPRARVDADGEVYDAVKPGLGDAPKAARSWQRPGPLGIA